MDRLLHWFYIVAARRPRLDAAQYLTDLLSESALGSVRQVGIVREVQVALSFLAAKKLLL